MNIGWLKLCDTSPSSTIVSCDRRARFVWFRSLSPRRPYRFQAGDSRSKQCGSFDSFILHGNLSIESSIGDAENTSGGQMIEKGKTAVQPNSSRRQEPCAWLGGGCREIPLRWTRITEYSTQSPERRVTPRKRSGR